LVSTSASFRRGRISVRVRCPASTAGSLALRTTGPLKGARRVLGSASFRCRAGATVTVRVAVPSATARLLRGRRRVAVTAVIATTGPAQRLSVIG
jgi:hypothetical protein